MGDPLLLLVIVPLIAGGLGLAVPPPLRKALAVAGTAGAAVLTAWLYGRTPEAVVLFGATALTMDALGYLALTFIQILAVIILVFSLKGVAANIAGPFFILYPLTVAFANGAVLSGHGIGLLVFWGLSGAALYGFGLLGRGRSAAATAKKTFIIIGGSDVFLLLGLALLGLRSGWLVGAGRIPLTDAGAWLAFGSLLVAALAKAGGFPFHTWVPDFCRDAPVESAALLPASIDKLLGIYLLARLMTGYFETRLSAQMIVVTIGALTVITGVMMALVQHEGRRLLGYHAVSQVGYMIMGVASGSAVAYAGGLFHLINNTIYKSGLFLSLGSVEKKTGTQDLNELGGLARAMPVTFGAALTGALAISGIPPLNGFFSKWMIYQGLLEWAPGLPPWGRIWLLSCLLLAVFGSALTLASLMKFIHAIFLGRRPDALAGTARAPFNQWLATGTLAALCVAFGFFARAVPLRALVYPAAEAGGWSGPQPAGIYDPGLVLLLFGAAFLVGLLVYLSIRKERPDELYLGGRAPEPAFRITGADFFKEVAEVSPMRQMYGLARDKVFDVYAMGGKAVLGFSRLLQQAHAGLLPVYALLIVLGLLVFLLLAL